MTAEDDKVEVEVEVEEGTSGSGKAASRIACPGYCVCCQPTCGIPIAFDSISHSLQSALPFNFNVSVLLLRPATTIYLRLVVVNQQD